MSPNPLSRTHIRRTKWRVPSPGGHTLTGESNPFKSSLKQSDYERAIQAHRAMPQVVIRGDLERTGQHWHLLNAPIADGTPSGENQDE